jgi:FO synthase
MGREDLRRLKAVSASQGLMLESTSPALLLPGGAHLNCPDKVGTSMGRRRRRRQIVTA